MNIGHFMASSRNSGLQCLLNTVEPLWSTHIELRLVAYNPYSVNRHRCILLVTNTVIVCFQEQKRKKRDEFKNIAVFPCKLRVLPQHIFNSRDPIIVGVSVEAGIVKEGTPLCVPSKNVSIVYVETRTFTLKP